MSGLILQGPRLTRAAAEELAAAVDGRAVHGDGQTRIRTARPVAAEFVQQLRGRFPFDVNPIAEDFDPSAARLLVTDMDSTLITIECVDEIADFIDRKAEVAAITAAAMRGELDFETSLRRRVGLLAGLDAGVLERVYAERLRLNDGAERLVAGLHARGMKVALVSGGFTFFTERLRARLALDYTLANELDIVDGRLTGKVHGAIVGAAAKEVFLRMLCERLGIRAAQSVAVGDGANDLPMLGAAGLGVAFRAKPAVQAQAGVVLNHSGLDAILAFLEN